MIPTKLSYSFAPGLQKLTRDEAKCVKKQLCSALGIKVRQDFYRKKHGIVNISKVAYDEVTSIFAEYGILEDQVWSITECVKN